MSSGGSAAATRVAARPPGLRHRAHRRLVSALSHARARARNRHERRHRVPWPTEAARSDAGDRVAAVVVDNGSRDGSVEMLDELERAGLVHVIRNRRHRYHGPGVNQGISWLARRQRAAEADQRIDYVWVLDSDVLLLRAAVVKDAVATLRRTGAAIIGQQFEGRVTDRELVALSTLMLDPSQVWRAPFPPFLDDGSPSDALQRAVLAAGLRIESFPFLHHSYVLHVGSGTLDQIADRGERGNRFYHYSLDHRAPHYNEHPLGPRLRAAVLAHYDRDVAEQDAAGLARACLEPALHTIPEAQPLPPTAELWRLHREGVDLGDYLMRLFAQGPAVPER